MRTRAMVTGLGASLLLACGAEPPRTMDARPAAGSTLAPQSAMPAPESGAGAPQPSASTGLISDPSAGSASEEDAATPEQCATAQYEAKLRPLDMLVLLDQSGSMTEHDDRWTPTTNAIKSFVRAPESAGIGVGLQYFPLGKNDGEKCEGATYAAPDVPIAQLPDNTQAMVESIDAHYFAQANCCDAPEHQGTPTRPAIEGVFQYLRAWLSMHPERDAVALLATDGEPSKCDANDIDDVSRVMSEAAGATPSLKTYVIGIGDEEDLEELAAAGGTGQGAFVVDGSGGMTEVQLLETLNAIRGESARCDFEVPSGMYSDPNLTNVEISYASRPRAQLVKVQDPEDCERAAQGGWHHDAATQRIRLCPEVCQSIHREPSAKVEVLVGCAAILL